MATKTKAVAAAKVSNVSKKVTQGHQRYTLRLNYLLNLQIMAKKKRVIKGEIIFFFFFSLIYSLFS